MVAVYGEENVSARIAEAVADTESTDTVGIASCLMLMVVWECEIEKAWAYVTEEAWACVTEEVSEYAIEALGCAIGALEHVIEAWAYAIETWMQASACNSSME